MSPTATQPAKHQAASTPPWRPADGPSSRPAGSLANGLSLLRCFSPEEPVLGIADLSERAGLARSVAHRHARTLLALGYLERRPSGKYRLGRLALDLGLAALRVNGLAELARPWLSWMRSTTGFTASLAWLDGEELVYALWLPSRLSSQSAHAAARRTGCSAAPHTHAAGLALLAYAEVEKWPAATRVHARDAPDRHGRLLEELERVCEQGYAVSKRSPRASGVGIAAPILGASEAIAAVELTVFGNQAGMFDQRRLSTAVVEAANGIAEQLEEQSRRSA